ncbi:MAG: acetyl-CoA carboxylase, biotin carboxyl carrier protein, partial [Streptococcaceae bacterium]|nr:acetyl-CoA carboxylase, biotin carboxyl carrier protein [Streptococcaceae bacterium]
MNLQDVKDLMSQFDESTVREFNLRSGNFEMYLSKNENNGKFIQAQAPVEQVVAPVETTPVTPVVESVVEQT